MRLSELVGKRIVNIYDGGVLGTVGDSDLLVDPETGMISAIILPSRGIRYRPGDRRQLVVPWEAVRKIGSEVIVVEMDGLYGNKAW